MAFFTRSFRNHIQDELSSRTFKESVQNVWIPHVRVTSLIEGTLSGVKLENPRLHGFTLGNVDVSKTPSIDDYFNTTGQGTAIGLTYTGAGNTAVQVKLNDAGNKGNKKLPPPGVTNVSISTQSTGGFIFKATVQLKFYGKEQYDVIWQTMLRPGNPIVIEYGQTQNPIGKAPWSRPALDGSMAVEYGQPRNQKDLGFFQALTQDVIDDFKSNLRDNVSLTSSRNSGRIVGLVSNFKVRLTEQNEYEAEIELINALEFLFTISPENTFMNYGRVASTTREAKPYLSKSIRSNFGWEKGEDYKPEYDNILKQVLFDALNPPDDDQPDWRKYILVPVAAIVAAYGGDTLTRGQARDFEEAAALGGAEQNVKQDEGPIAAGLRLAGAAMSASAPLLGVFMQAAATRVSARVDDDHSTAVYISLEYFLSKLLNDIIKRAYYDKENLCQSIFNQQNLANEQATFLGFAQTWGNFVQGGPHELMFLDESGRPLTLVEHREVSDKVVLDATQPINSVGFWQNLRSVDIKNVIINNVNIYNSHPDLSGAGAGDRPITDDELGDAAGGIGDLSQMSGYFFRTHVLDYMDRFGDAYTNETIVRMFKYNQNWGPRHKVVYRQLSDDNPEHLRTNFEGIFINYEKIRSAFMGSTSVGEAIQKVLNVVNVATTGILKLKMRFMELEEVNVNAAVYGVHKQLITVNKIKIYDENALPSKEDVVQRAQPYKFFEGNVSEAMSYNFDFSLPGSVAATVLANTFEPTEMNAAGGDPEKKALISYGYALDSSDPPQLALKSLVNLHNLGDSDKTMPCDNVDRHTPDDPAKKSVADMESDEFYRAKLGYKEFDPPKMMEKAIRSGLYNVIPSAGKINIKLQGLDGFRFGDMFTVLNILPKPFDENNIFMVTGYKHDINSQGWYTELNGTMIASIPKTIKKMQKALQAEYRQAKETAGPGISDEKLAWATRERPAGTG